MKALVLSGGGAKGAYQVGALKRWMSEDGCDYQAICGISVGAINGAFLAQFGLGNPKLAADSLEALWGRVDNGNVKRNWFPFGVLESIFKPSVYDSRPLQDWIRRELDVKKIKQSGRQLRVVAVSWNSGEPQVAKESDDDLASWVIASSAFPVMLSSISLGGELWTDGGLRSVTPLGQAINLGATSIDVVMCTNPYAPNPFDPAGKGAIPTLALRAIDILIDQVTRADLEICGLRNDLVGLKGSNRLVELRMLQPSRPLASNSLDFDPAALKEMMALGYEDAARPQKGVSFDEVRAFTKKGRAPGHDGN